MEKTKLLVDTDIGDDIDDAIAIIMALKSDAQIVGFTTVGGNTEGRARMVKRLLALSGREGIPVYAGGGGESEDENAPLPPLFSEELFSEEYAPDGVGGQKTASFITEQCRRYGGELTLLAIGPLTNIAAAARLDAQALRGVRTVMMGGAYFRQYADWNVSCDAESASYIFDTLPYMHCIGADVTHGLRLTDEDEELMRGYRGDCPMLGYLSELFSRYKSPDPTMPRTALHDPLALCYALDTSLCRMKEGRVQVVTAGCARGLTLNVESYGKSFMNPYYKDKEIPTQLLATEADTDRAFGKFRALFKN